MVAFTPIYELPYQEGTDPPCFGPGTGCDNLTSVWCDFAALVEEQLVAFDNVIGRTAAAIPMAKITVASIWQPTQTPGVIPFDTVVFDTDSMVDFNAGAGITPSRNGIYRIDLRAHFDTYFPVNDSLLITINLGSESLPQNLFGAVSTGHTKSQGTPAIPIFRGAVRSSTLYNFTSITPSPRMVVGAVAGGPLDIDELGISYTAELEVYWQGEAL